MSFSSWCFVVCVGSSFGRINRWWCWIVDMTSSSLIHSGRRTDFVTWRFRRRRSITKSTSSTTHRLPPTYHTYLSPQNFLVDASLELKPEEFAMMLFKTFTMMFCSLSMAMAEVASLRGSSSAVVTTSTERDNSPNRNLVKNHRNNIMEVEEISLHGNIKHLPNEQIQEILTDSPFAGFLLFSDDPNKGARGILTSSCTLPDGQVGANVCSAGQDRCVYIQDLKELPLHARGGYCQDFLPLKPSLAEALGTQDPAMALGLWNTCAHRDGHNCA